MSHRESISGRRKVEQENDWERSERRSTWIALTIALAPIPIAVLISWALGSPPWLEHSKPGERVPPADSSAEAGSPGAEHH
jgi:hypothetical protein